MKITLEELNPEVALNVPTGDSVELVMKTVQTDFETALAKAKAAYGDDPLAAKKAERQRDIDRSVERIVKAAERARLINSGARMHTN